MVEVPVANKDPKRPATVPAPMHDPFRAIWRGLFGVEPAGRYESSCNFAAPAVDVTEDDKAYKVSAEMPGLDERNIEILIAGDMLTLKGEKRQDQEEKDENRYVSERAYGSFERRFALPDSIDRDKIAAELTKGVLTITLPKKTAAQHPEKKIEVKAAA